MTLNTAQYTQTPTMARARLFGTSGGPRERCWHFVSAVVGVLHVEG